MVSAPSAVRRKLPVKLFSSPMVPVIKRGLSLLSGTIGTVAGVVVVGSVWAKVAGVIKQRIKRSVKQLYLIIATSFGVVWGIWRG